MLRFDSQTLDKQQQVLTYMDLLHILTIRCTAFCQHAPRIRTRVTTVQGKTIPDLNIVVGDGAVVVSVAGCPRDGHLPALGVQYLRLTRGAWHIWVHTLHQIKTTCLPE